MRWGRKGSRGVSEVVATILLLALTVTLFSSIFYFVNTFPQPSPQPTNQFTASLTYHTSGSTTSIIGISILHLAGPTVPGTSEVYLYSSDHPTRFTTPFTVTSGLPGHPAVWNLGQTWYQNLTNYTLTSPDNITVSLTTTSELLFRVTLPGTNPAVPPVFTNEGTTPTVPTVSGEFTIFVQISDPNLKTNSVYLNLSQMPGNSGSGLHKLTYSSTNGTWWYVVGSGITTTAGTFYAFVNASDTLGLSNIAAFAITLASPSGASGQVTAVLVATPVTPVAGKLVNVTAYVTNNGASSTSASLVFYAGATNLGSTTGPVAAGGTSGFREGWTPSSAGVYLLEAAITSSTSGTLDAILNITVYPTIVLVSHNVAQGNRTVYNESALLAEELTADGIPYSTLFVACTASLTSAELTAYSVAVIDYGSNTISGCPKAASSTDQTAITTAAATTSIVIVGANAYATTTCSTYAAAFFTDFGLTTPGASGTCQTDGAAAAAATYTAATASDLLGDGMPATLEYNKTLLTSSAFIPYDTFGKGATNSFMKVGAAVNGAFKTSGSLHFVALAGDPALLATTLPAPASASWGTGQAGADLMYNVMGYVTGLAGTSATGRALIDYGVDQATIVGQSHSRTSSIYVGVRDNGPAAGLVTVTLLVNGTVALLNGQVVTATISLTGSGSSAYVVLQWLAPSTGPYTLSVSETSVPSGLYGPDDVMPFNVLNQATVFT